MKTSCMVPVLTPQGAKEQIKSSKNWNQGTLWYVASIFDMRESVKCVIILDAYPLYAQESGLYLFFCFVLCFQTQLIINRRQQQLKADDEENEVKKKMVMKVG